MICIRFIAILWLKYKECRKDKNYVPTNLIHDILHKSILRTKCQCRAEQFLKVSQNNQCRKWLIYGERGTGWVFLVEYTESEGGKSAYTMSSNLGFLIKRNSISILSKNWKRKLRKFKQMEKEYCKVNDSDLYNRYSNMFNC